MSAWKPRAGWAIDWIRLARRVDPKTPAGRKGRNARRRWRAPAGRAGAPYVGELDVPARQGRRYRKAAARVVRGGSTRQVARAKAVMSKIESKW